MPKFLFDPNEIAGKQITKPRGFISDPCKLCGLYKHCKNPKLKAFGKFEKKILVLGEAPGKDEDESGRNFVGRSGKLLSDAFSVNGIDIDKDCSRTNVLQCRPPNNEFDIDKVQFCYERLEQQIRELQPVLIMCFGLNAVRRIIETNIVPGLAGQGNMGLLRGDVYPSRKYNCWVSCHYHPAYILRTEDMSDIFIDDIAEAIPYIEYEIPEPICENGENIFVTDETIAIEYLKMFSESKQKVSFDYETNMLDYFRDDAKIIVVSLSKSPELGIVIPLIQMGKKVHKAFAGFLQSDAPKVSHNAKFEENWSYTLMGVRVNNWYWDSILSQHIIDQRRDKKSLEYLVYKETGEEYKDEVDRKHMMQEFEQHPDKVIKYSSLDSRFPLLITDSHRDRLTYTKQLDAMNLLMDGNMALSRLEQNGVLIDEKAYRDYKVKVETRVEETHKLVMQSSLVKKWFKDDFNPNSNPDLAKLFSKLSIISESGSYDDEFLNGLQNYEDTNVSELAVGIQDFRGATKLNGTYLNSIEKYVDSDWFLHPNYNLWIPATFRSSSSNPNLQNLPKRDDMQKEFRKIFIPVNDLLMEADYKGAEVVMQAMLANDENLIKQLNAKYDMHRFWASKLFKISEDKVTKKQRYKSKNGFVFPKIYGSYYKSIAKNVGLPESHVEKVEREFLDLYYGIDEWQQKQERFYIKHGYVEIPFGFRRYGPLSFNQIVNTPIQGGTFLGFLLDSLIQLMLGEELEKRKMKTVPVLQVHDSILFDVVEEEKDELMEMINFVGTNKEHLGLRNDVLLQIEWEEGINWLEMKEVKS